MPSIHVVLSIMDLNLQVDAEMPTKVMINVLIHDLADHFDLPWSDNIGQRIIYKIQSKALGRFLSETTTLAEAQIPEHDRLTLHREEIAGGGDGPREWEERIKFGTSSTGIKLEGLDEVEIKSLLSNKTAMLMTLHSYRKALNQLEEMYPKLERRDEEIRELNNRLREKNVATILLLLGQVQIGFGTNLITNGVTGGWFLFFSGAIMDAGALLLSLFGAKKSRYN